MKSLSSARQPKRKGKYPLTICKLTRNGREAFEVYSVKMRFVTGQPSKS